MKKKILTLLLASSSLMQAMEMTNLKEGLKNKSENKLEKFKCFKKLPKDIQNEIINHLWLSTDNFKNFEQFLLNWQNLDNLYKQEAQTSKDEKKQYNFYGKKTPINFYTLEHGCPIIKTVGVIIDKPDPQDHRNYKNSLSTKLFLHGPDKKTYSTTLINSSNTNNSKEWNVCVTSACFSVLGDVAIVWSPGREHGYKVTILSLSDIKKNNTIDLQKNSIDCFRLPYKDLRFPKEKKEKYLGFNTIKGSLFRLDGSGLVICVLEDLPHGKVYEKYEKNDLIKHINNCCVQLNYMPLKPKNPLSPTEKAKRLELFTKEVTKMIREKKNKNNHMYFYAAATGLGIGAILGGVALWNYCKK